VATAYVRLRLFWGALDLEAEEARTPGYGSTQIVSGGDAATIGSGIGVRRASLELDRSSISALLDPAYVHFDFLNTTSGAPDDTWILSDFTTLETALQAWWNNTRSFMVSGYKMTRIIWHRVGSGVGKPNPAERVLTITTPALGTEATGGQALQVACSITFRTGVRRSWGRTYLPFSRALPGSTSMLPSATVDSVASYTNTLVNSAAAGDFHLVVVSKPLASALVVEQIEVDDVLDIIRRRRPKRSTYKKLLP
jgi:hypothetical protein